jgi:hypothetical protein
MEHVLSLSYGKDSLACLGAIEQLGWPLDRIVHAEVWATDTIPADLPPMVEFKAKADEIIKKRWGIEVERCVARNVDKVLLEKVSYQDYFYQIMQEGKHKGTIKGFSMQKGNWCTKLKLCAFPKYEEKTVEYLGIAADEPNRFHNLTETKKSPLVEIGWDEAYCRQWCEENGLLSPIYTTATRGGCWFCHNQGVGQLRLLRKNYPDLWALMLKWDKDSPVSFKPDEHTVHDYDRRFQMEDDGFIRADERWKWEYLDSELVNYRLF